MYPAADGIPIAKEKSEERGASSTEDPFSFLKTYWGLVGKMGLYRVFRVSGLGLVGTKGMHYAGNVFPYALLTPRKFRCAMLVSSVQGAIR